MKIIIPARRNSKGLPFKNRKLFKYTINSIPSELFDNVVVSTDDEVILKEAKEKKLNVLWRSEKLSGDTVPISDVMGDVIQKLNVPATETVIMLYLTYPERSWEDITKALEFYNETQTKSLLCKKELKTSPFLCMIEDGLNGKQIVKHNLYRRQDYPKCFEISHFVCIFQAEELKKLNENMYNTNTAFFQIRSIVDVDTNRDMEVFYDQNNS